MICDKNQRRQICGIMRDNDNDNDDYNDNDNDNDVDNDDDDNDGDDMIVLSRLTPPAPAL